MSLPELCIRHKAAVAILTAVAFLAGILSWREMNQELIPNISMPTIYIAIPYEGASADQINDKITKILENEFSTMPNLTEMTATNFSGVALMLLTFDDSIDLLRRRYRHSDFFVCDYQRLRFRRAGSICRRRTDPRIIAPARCRRSRNRRLQTETG